MPAIEDPSRGSSATADESYTDRLATKQGAWWKRLVPVQLPYRWNIRRLAIAPVLDVGCGLGRNLDHLDGHGVGVDTNPHSVEVARQRGLTAYTPAQFLESADAKEGAFATLLSAHVIEHLGIDTAQDVLSSYMRFLRPNARLILIVPQEAGYRSDTTHVEFFDTSKLSSVAAALGFEVERTFSFPLPRKAGRVFTYNELVLVGRRLHT